MSTARIQRYIIREVVAPTVMGLLIFTLVVLMGRMLKLVEMVLNKGIPVSEIALLFAYMMPAFLVITLPLAFLMGILLGFGRLSADAEIIALKSSGISLKQLLTPVLVVAVLASLLTAALTLYAAPASNSAFRTKIFEIASQRASVGLQPQVFNADFDDLVLYTDELDDRTGRMRGVFISDERISDIQAIITARNGNIISDADEMSLTLHLEDGSIHRQAMVKGEEAYQVIDFATYDINLAVGETLISADNRRKKEKEMSMQDLFTLHEQAEPGKESSKYMVEILHRFSLPFAPLIFALVGIPLGIQSTRSGRGGGFALALLVFLVYYVLYSLTKTLAIDAGMPPYIVLLPALLFLFGGGYMMNVAANEKPIVWLELLQDGMAKLKRSRKQP